MSTVLETIQARALGLPVAAFSCLTNWGAGMTSDHLDHHEVLETGKAAAQVMIVLLKAVIGRCGMEGRDAWEPRRPVDATDCLLDSAIHPGLCVSGRRRGRSGDQRSRRGGRDAFHSMVSGGREYHPRGDAAPCLELLDCPVGP